MTEIELKPCPFCGKRAIIKDFGVSREYGCRDIRVGCVDAFLPRGDWGAPKDPCPISPIAYSWSIGAETPEQMAKAWNRRAERTCHVEATAPLGMIGAGKAYLLSCGHSCDGGGVRPKHCPECGAKVVGE